MSQLLSDCLSEEVELKVSPKEVLHYRYSPQGELELLTKWDDLPNYGKSQELYKNLNQLFQHLHLEDKLSPDGQGNVRSHEYVKRGNKEVTSKSGKKLELTNGK